MAKKARFGDWTKGEVRETTTWNVSYSVSFSDGKSTSGKVQVICHTREQAGKRVVSLIKRRDPQARVTVRRIWAIGETPGGLHLPSGLEWVDSEIEGKHKKPL